jgi:transposase
VTAKQAAVKKYVVTLNDDERERLNTMIHNGKHRARQLVKARILLKADASDAGEGWSDSQIAAALDTSVDTVARTRQQLVEEGVESVLTRKHSPASARRRIFDGAAEAKLIALACSNPPKGRVRWTLKLLETAVVELNIVDRASDNTIGRTLKKRYCPGSASAPSSGSTQPRRLSATDLVAWGRSRPRFCLTKGGDVDSRIRWIAPRSANSRKTTSSRCCWCKRRALPNWSAGSG